MKTYKFRKKLKRNRKEKIIKLVKLIEDMFKSLSEKDKKNK